MKQVRAKSRFCGDVSQVRDTAAAPLSAEAHESRLAGRHPIDIPHAAGIQPALAQLALL